MSSSFFFPSISKECVADTTSPDGYSCRCEAKADEMLYDESCNLCKGPSPPVEAKCPEIAEILITCNPEGTESIMGNELCKCKVSPDFPKRHL